MCLSCFLSKMGQKLIFNPKAKPNPTHPRGSHEPRYLLSLLLYFHNRISLRVSNTMVNAKLSILYRVSTKNFLLTLTSNEQSIFNDELRSLLFAM